ncbi:hypothetical protein PGT21_008162 [Puccinia graminis f. sp. tritici]|uniref:Uncharacterized protein n=1 Tax=Puccinia graminis f. sp. tritici TaxID=56615 RepID=A0A5B0M1W3_PUCGR|nr:hypothetical protein PGT21_008162 [Puccinia graminis f. sp. tritici]KAA1090087.1 hypothetical protein PGTUg99_035347 [Puccinia graminis f. sp. tritici]
MFRGLSNPADSNYGRRIRNLEEVVCHLLANRQHPAPVTGSFRYSIKRGLEPIVSGETAMLLTNNWRPRQSARRKSLSSTASVNYRPSITPSSCPDSTRSSSPTSLPKGSPTSPTPSTSLSNPTPPTIVGVSDSTNPAESFPASDPANKPTIQNPLSSNPASRPPSPLISSQSDRSSVLPPPALPLSTETAGNTSPLPITVTGLSSLRLAAGPPSVLQENSSPSRSRSLDRFPLDACAKVPKAEYASVTRSPSSVIAIVAEPPASSSIDVVSASEIIVTTEDPTLTSSVLDPFTQAATLDTLGSKNHIFEASHQEATQINHPIGIVPPTPLSSINSISDSTTSTATSTSSNYHGCPSPVYPTTKVCPKNTEVAEAGSLAIENDESVSMDSKITPEYSHTTLEYYNDIDNYLKLSGVNETQTRRKKKKKKKSTNHSSNLCISAPPVDIPIAAVGSLTVMSEEKLAALERQHDPRYRPIEDSEFIPFEDW